MTPQAEQKDERKYGKILRKFELIKKWRKNPNRKREILNEFRPRTETRRNQESIDRFQTASEIRLLREQLHVQNRPVNDRKSHRYALRGERRDIKKAGYSVRDYNKIVSLLDLGNQDSPQNPQLFAF